MGAARPDLDTGFSGTAAEIDDDAVEFAWNVGAGVWARVFHKIEIGVGYRFLDMGEPAFGSNLGFDFDVELRFPRVLLGVQPRF